MKKTVHALLMMLALLGGITTPMVARAQAVPEYVLKATYLYNFMLYTAWPDTGRSGSGGYKLCVLGQDTFGSALDDLAQKSLHGGKLGVVRLNGLTDVRKCHLLFVTEREAANMDVIRRQIGDAPVLTVTDSPTAADAAILLLLDGQRLVFFVNQSAVKRAGLNLSSKVLQLARGVSG
jgi:hypothetical protein